MCVPEYNIILGFTHFDAPCKLGVRAWIDTVFAELAKKTLNCGVLGLFH